MDLSVANHERVLPEPVIGYCSKHQLLSQLNTAIRLAELHFDPVNDLRVGVEADPDADDDFLVIDVSLAMDADEVLRRKYAYTRDWVNSTPAEGRERIRLLYHILESHSDG